MLFRSCYGGTNGRSMVATAQTPTACLYRLLRRPFVPHRLCLVYAGSMVVGAETQSEALFTRDTVGGGERLAYSATGASASLRSWSICPEWVRAPFRKILDFLLSLGTIYCNVVSNFMGMELGKRASVGWFPCEVR